MPVYHRAASPLEGRIETEDGPDARRVHQYISTSGTNAMVGFACHAGVKRNQGRPGAKHAPLAIRQALASLAAADSMPAIADLGDIVVDGDDLEAGQALLASHLGDALARHQRIVVLGGGHETAFGSFGGLRLAFPDQKIGIINLDAHLDLRAIGSHGASSGTPFFQIREQAPDDFEYLCLGVAQESNTTALFNRATDWRVSIVEDHALIQDRTAADAAIDVIASRCDLIYLTIDMDVLPHYQACGVSAPATRGVPLNVIEHIIDAVTGACHRHQTKLPLADIVEVCPPHDANGLTARTAALLARRLLQSTIRADR
ncbi:MAG: formimidoylglutamase [Woeseiaceae bacterium]